MSETSNESLNWSDPSKAMLGRWLMSFDTGASSLCLLAAAITGRAPDPLHHPHDSGDLHRCFNLVQLIPETESALPVLAAASREWRGLLGYWEFLKHQDALGDPDMDRTITRILHSARKPCDPVTDAADWSCRRMPANEPPPAKKDFRHSDLVLVWYMETDQATAGFGVAYYHHRPPFGEAPRWVNLDKFFRDRTPLWWWPLPPASYI